MKSDIQNYLKLQSALLNEKTKIEARLNAINKVLGGDVAVVAPTAKPGGRRTFSAAIKAKMAAAQKARWAVRKGVVESAVAPAATKKAKRTMSEATKAKMRAAHQARWAKLKGKNPAPASAPTPKKKRKMSAAGKANIIAAVKARWAKVNAQKKTKEASISKLVLRPLQHLSRQVACKV
jgi:hypothetical protein